MNLIEISQQLLKASKSTSSITSFLNYLEKVALTDLYTHLDTDDKKKAFWINIYNAYTAFYLKPNPNVILNPISRKIFFNTNYIKINDCSFSLNDVEHDILRKSKIWWSKGYLNKLIVKSCFKNLRVEKFDSRIHFALNCGGMGCPPIRYYDHQSINQQLEIATEAFLFSEVKEDVKTHELKISKLFNWYIGDFGGKTGLINFFKKYNALSVENYNPIIKYTAYNWQPWIK